MTADDMGKMAEHAEHMAKWCRANSKERAGLVVVSWIDAAVRYEESALYWREQSEK